MRLPIAEHSSTRLDGFPERGFVTAVTLRTKTSIVLIVLLVTIDTGWRRCHLLIHLLDMAGVTIESLVTPIQLEFRPGIVFKVPELPIPDAVAVLALRTQPAPMYVIVLVASVAGGGRLVLIQTSGVATLTGCCTVLTEESVFGVSIVIEGDRLPSVLVVTPLAPGSEVGSMNIVLLMARMAVGRCLIFVERASMATVAFHLSVVAFEEIRGIPIVLKEQDLPVSLAVTTLAFLGESALMLVVFLVAGKTIDGGLVPI